MITEKEIIDRIAGLIIQFFVSLHGCHICRYKVGLINGKGKDRTTCTKYGMHISRVRDQCIDRFPGITMSEMKEIARQYKDGTCEINLPNIDRN